MLRIEVPNKDNSGLTFSELEKYDIPSPPDGFKSEINDRVILQFEDEREAVNYSKQIGRYAKSLKDHSSPEYGAVINIIDAIHNDVFVRDYVKR
jgi:hypothetical protein